MLSRKARHRRPSHHASSAIGSGPGSADRPRPKLLAVRSALGRHVFVFVWLPRDEISTGLRRGHEALHRGKAGAVRGQRQFARRLQRREASEVYSLVPERDDEVKALIDETGRAGDTLGGAFEVVVRGRSIPFAVLR